MTPLYLSREEFEERGFVQVAAVKLWKGRGFPLYENPDDALIRTWIPGWAADLFHGVCDYRPNNAEFDKHLAVLAGAAGRSADPDAAVASFLTAYRLGGFPAALELARAAQGGGHDDPRPDGQP